METSHQTANTILAVALIVGGLSLIAAPLIQEAYYYPWKQVALAADMPEPPLPSVPFISYEEYLRSEMVYVPTPLAEESEESVSDATPFILLGTVKIPRMDVAENLLEGTYDEMHYGIGHLAGTPLPGGEGNAVIAAHRVSSRGMFPFRYLDLLENGDTVTVELGSQTFTYEVYDSFIVSQNDIWVLEALEDESHVLTLVSCDPVVYPTRRPNRLIVRARLVASEFI
jgi:sortase A